MNNSSFDCSLNDLTELKQLIIENPDLPLLIFCGEEAWTGEWGYEMACVNGQPYIEELALYGDYWVDRDDYEERLGEDLWDDYQDLSDEEYDKMIKQKVSEIEFVKAIVIHVG